MLLRRRFCQFLLQDPVTLGRPRVILVWGQARRGAVSFVVSVAFLCVSAVLTVVALGTPMVDATGTPAVATVVAVESPVIIALSILSAVATDVIPIRLAQPDDGAMAVAYLVPFACAVYFLFDCIRFVLCAPKRGSSLVGISY